MNKLIPAAGGKSLSQGNKTVCHMRRRAARCVRRVLGRQRPMDRPLRLLSQLPQPRNVWLRDIPYFYSSPSLARAHTHTPMRRNTHSLWQTHLFLKALCCAKFTQPVFSNGTPTYETSPSASSDARTDSHKLAVVEILCDVTRGTNASLQGWW